MIVTTIITDSVLTWCVIQQGGWIFKNILIKVKWTTVVSLVKVEKMAEKYSPVTSSIERLAFCGSFTIKGSDFFSQWGLMGIN